MSTGKGRQMKKSLDHWVAPRLHEKGFLGAFPTLRRTRGKLLDIVELQFDKNGGGFRLNLGVCPSDGVVTPMGKHVPPEEVTPAYEMLRKYFLDPRIVNPGDSQECWFRFDEKNTDQVAREMIPHIALAENWFLTGEGPVIVGRKKSASSAVHRFFQNFFSRPV